MRKLLSVALCLHVLFVLSGCGRSGLPGLAPAAGIVTLNGEPVEGAVISFAPTSGTRSATAVSDASGKFVVTTLDYGDGIQPGEYQVIVTKKTGSSGNTSSSPEKDKDRRVNRQDGRLIVNHLPLKYENRETSGLAVSISSRGNKNIALELEGAVDLTPRNPSGPKR